MREHATSRRQAELGADAREGALDEGGTLGVHSALHLDAGALKRIEGFFGVLTHILASYTATYTATLTATHTATHNIMSHDSCVGVSSLVLWCVAVCSSVLQFVVECCSVLQRVAACCSVCSVLF